jgi:hypothetical protein
MTLQITDHATLRYIERVLGLNVSDVRNRIRAICQDAAKAGAKAVIHEGFNYKLSPSRSHVVTIAPDKPRPKKQGRA